MIIYAATDHETIIKIIISIDRRIKIQLFRIRIDRSNGTRSTPCNFFTFCITGKVNTYITIRCTVIVIADKGTLDQLLVFR